MSGRQAAQGTEPTGAGGGPGTGASVLLLGDGPLPAAVVRALERRGARVRWLRRPADRELSSAVVGGCELVMIVSREDILALRLALLVEHARSGVPLIVTLFDRTVAAQIKRAVPHCQVVSMADLVAPSLAGPCLAEEICSLIEVDGRLRAVREPAATADAQPAAVDDVSVQTLIPRHGLRFMALLSGALRPVDASARILLAGASGFLLILLAELALALGFLHQSLPTALYETTLELVAVGPNPAFGHAAAWLKVLDSVLLLAALAFAAIVTAGIVNRLLDKRLTTMLGRRVVPRRDHVIVVGLGQVGLRLAALLRELGVGVVAVERRAEAPYLAFARRYAIPVVVGSGADRELLERVGALRARALAAVTSDELTNVAVAVAALAIHPQLRVVLRAGEGEVSQETRALFHIGLVRDLHRIAAELLAALALG
jgi:hypothetical protein